LRPSVERGREIREPYRG